jgi:hypothetical protein
VLPQPNIVISGDLRLLVENDAKKRTMHFELTFDFANHMLPSPNLLVNVAQLSKMNRVQPNKIGDVRAARAGTED